MYLCCTSCRKVAISHHLPGLFLDKPQVCSTRPTDMSPHSFNLIKRYKEWFSTPYSPRCRLVPHAVPLYSHVPRCTSLPTYGSCAPPTPPFALCVPLHSLHHTPPTFPPCAPSWSCVPLHHSCALVLCSPWSTCISLKFDWLRIAHQQIVL